MFYADTVGLPNVLGTIERLSRGRHGEAWKPAPLLVSLATEGKGFNG
jgi:3-hydroxyacyl-CoA dehydrogenase